MLVGAFFILRWANKNDKSDGDVAENVQSEERPVGFVLPKLKTEDSELDVRQQTSV